MKPTQNIKPEHILKVVSIGIPSSFISEPIGSVHPKEAESLYKIVKDRWYHHPVQKLIDKYIVWKYERKGLCTCECHRKKGFSIVGMAVAADMKIKNFRRIIWVILN